jgi:hypothetical protein
MATRPRKSEEKASTGKGTAAKPTVANAKANGTTKANGAKAAAAKTVAKATAVRKPRAKKTEPPVVTEQMIAERAYYIALSGTGASDHENWLRAEAELRA